MYDCAKTMIFIRSSKPVNYKPKYLSEINVLAENSKNPKLPSCLSKQLKNASSSFILQLFPRSSLDLARWQECWHWPDHESSQHVLPDHWSAPLTATRDSKSVTTTVTDNTRILTSLQSHIVNPTYP